MSAEAQAPDNVVNFTQADASDLAKPSLIPFEPNEGQTVQALVSDINAANVNLQAFLYQMAVVKGVDLSAYEFNYQAGGFVKKG